MSSPSNERRRHPRGNELVLRLTLGGLRWVYAYAAALVVLSAAPAALAWMTAGAGTAEELAAANRLELLVREFALPLGLVALAVSAHVGWFAGRAARYVTGVGEPFAVLRNHVARRDELSEAVRGAISRAADAVDDADVPRQEVAVLVHEALDAAEQQIARPRASVIDPAAGERTPAAEANVASALRG